MPTPTAVSSESYTLSYSFILGDFSVMHITSRLRHEKTLLPTPAGITTHTYCLLLITSTDRQQQQQRQRLSQAGNVPGRAIYSTTPIPLLPTHKKVQDTGYFGVLPGTILGPVQFLCCSQLTIHRIALLRTHY